MTSWRELRNEAQGWTRCGLYERATQTVFGQGPASAAIALAGEQPGDQEDKQGRPFTGPAGRVLDRALEEARLSRDDLYLTNAVKHFKWAERGKRRITSGRAVLRGPDQESRDRAYAGLVSDLVLARETAARQ